MTLTSAVPQHVGKTARGSMIVADIGGTNARFGALDPRTGGIGHIRNLTCAGKSSLVSLVIEYLQVTGLPGPSHMCVALAGPINGDRCGLTNSALSFSITQVEQDLKLESFVVINDFAAIAAAIPELDGPDLAPIGTAGLLDGLPKTVIGPGTGLGMAGLVPAGTGWHVVAGQGGHIPAAAHTDLEHEVIRALRRTHGYVSAETIVSGPGLVRTYRAICEVLRVEPTPLTPAQISEKAIHRTDFECQATLTLFCDQLASVASAAAMTYGATGGVYLAGGIPAKISALLDGDQFRARFDDHPQMHDYLAAIGIARITHDNPGLLGASTYITSTRVA